MKTELHEDSAACNKPNLSFTGAKLDWMTAAAYDRRLKSIDFRIPFIIAQHTNEKTGKAFPSQETIADLSGSTPRTVKRTVKLLQATGWLKIKRKRDYDPKTKTWRTRNIYWLLHDNVQTMFDNMAASKIGRRYGSATSVTGDPLTSVTHDTLTPSDLHLQKGRSLPREERLEEREERLSARRLPLMRVIGGGWRR